MSPETVLVIVACALISAVSALLSTGLSGRNRSSDVENLTSMWSSEVSQLHAERRQLLLVITAQHADPLAVQVVSRAAGHRPEPTTDERKPVVIPTDI